MKAYPNFSKEEYLSRSQVLSSLVLNLPYKVDGYTTSPKISKLIAFPFGIKVDSYFLYRNAFHIMFSLLLIMAISCVSVICIYVPLNHHNVQLFDTVRSQTNERFALLAELQEASSYSKLFSGARLLSFEDPKEIIRVNSGDQLLQKFKVYTTYNEYPSVRFVGF